MRVRRTTLHRQLTRPCRADGEMKPAWKAPLGDDCMAENTPDMASVRSDSYSRCQMLNGTAQ
jgi:hypothetical protein